jgi:hypothetical protein
MKISIAIVALSLFVFLGGPLYGVWQQSLSGKAELEKAEYTRKVDVLEAQANEIIGESLKDNPAYLQYLWITQGEENANRTVYMVPSSGGAPVPTFDIEGGS